MQKGEEMNDMTDEELVKEYAIDVARYEYDDGEEPFYDVHEKELLSRLYTLRQQLEEAQAYAITTLDPINNSVMAYKQRAEQAEDDLKYALERISNLQKDIAELKKQRQTDALDGQAEMDMTNNVVLKLQAELAEARQKIRDTEWIIYRRLEEGEMTQKGDQVLLPDEDAEWEDVGDCFRPAPSPLYPAHCIYRRSRIKSLEAELAEANARHENALNKLAVYEKQLVGMKEKGKGIIPIVVMCGSSRYVDIMAVCAWYIERDEKKNTMGLHLLPEWYCKGNIPDHLAEHENCAAEMDELHLRKIDIADEVFVVNCNDYIGESTTREVRYAIDRNKKIRWFTHDEIGEKVRQAIKQFAEGK